MNKAGVHNQILCSPKSFRLMPILEELPDGLPRFRMMYPVLYTGCRSTFSFLRVSVIRQSGIHAKHAADKASCYIGRKNVTGDWDAYICKSDSIC